MNYYDEIKKELVNNEINRKVKSYSINKKRFKCLLQCWKNVK